MNEFEWIKDIPVQLEPLTMETWYEGLRVMISKDSKYYDDDCDEYNPKDIEGSCMEKVGHRVLVIWDNGYENGYTYGDLVIV